MNRLARTAGAEFIGALLLSAIVIGSGIAAASLSPGDVGLQLLQNSLATTLGLAVLIAVFQPVSGAHFNPAVTLVEAALAPRGERPKPVRVIIFIAVQVAGCIAGAMLANAMFDLPAAAWSTTDRASGATLLAEVVATAGLVLVIVGLVRAGQSAWVAPAVGAYIGAAYWFTSSTSFANPAITIGRAFTDTFAGIAPASVLPFIAAQLVGAAVGAAVAVALFVRPEVSQIRTKVADSGPGA
mgnify:CR=1 FL=1